MRNSRKRERLSHNGMFTQQTHNRRGRVGKIRESIIFPLVLLIFGFMIEEWFRGLLLGFII